MEKEQRYFMEDKLGEGTYGIVYRGIDKQTGQQVAVKKIKLEQEEDEGIPATTLREISVLKQLKHPNLVQLLDIIVEHQKIYLIFEYIDNDLRKFLNNLEKPLDKKYIQYIMKQILQGVLFMHQNGIIHRDLKPQNILISKDGLLKIADFGLCRSLSLSLSQKKPPLTKEIVTLWYRSPELLLGEQNYSEEIDTWAIGCIFIELFIHKPIFMGDSQIDQLFKIFQYSGTPNKDRYQSLMNYEIFKQTFPRFTGNGVQQWKLKDRPDFGDLEESFMLTMLNVDPDQRWSLNRILDHPYFLQKFD